MAMISVNFFDMVKFIKLCDENRYLSKVIENVDGKYTTSTNDTREIERILNSNGIRFKIKKI